MLKTFVPCSCAHATFFNVRTHKLNSSRTDTRNNPSFLSETTLGTQGTLGSPNSSGGGGSRFDDGHGQGDGGSGDTEREEPALTEEEKEARAKQLAEMEADMYVEISKAVLGRDHQIRTLTALSDAVNSRQHGHGHGRKDALRGLTPAQARWAAYFSQHAHKPHKSLIETEEPVSSEDSESGDSRDGDGHPHAHAHDSTRNHDPADAEGARAKIKPRKGPNRSRAWRLHHCQFSHELPIRGPQFAEMIQLDESIRDNLYDARNSAV